VRQPQHVPDDHPLLLGRDDPRGDGAIASRDTRAMALVGGSVERESEPREVFTDRGANRPTVNRE